MKTSKVLELLHKHLADRTEYLYQLHSLAAEGDDITRKINVLGDLSMIVEKVLTEVKLQEETDELLKETHEDE